jgi:hypothetical protein
MAAGAAGHQKNNDIVSSFYVMAKGTTGIIEGISRMGVLPKYTEY